MFALIHGRENGTYSPRTCKRLNTQKQEILFVIFSIISVVCLLQYSKSLHLEDYPPKIWLGIYLFGLTASTVLIIKKICDIYATIFPRNAVFVLEEEID